MPLSITPHIVTEIFQLADYYNMPELMSQCAQSLRECIDTENCCHLIKIVSQLNVNIESCEEFMAKNLAQILSNDNNEVISLEV